MEIIHWCEIEGFGPFYGVLVRKIPRVPRLTSVPPLFLQRRLAHLPYMSSDSGGGGGGGGDYLVTL